MSDFSVDFCNVKGLLSFEEAKALLLNNVVTTQKTQKLPIENALNYVLAENIISPINVPPHDNSAMDGYAFAMCSYQKNLTLKLAGKSFAGQPYEGECQLGECIRIMTGAKLPKGCDTVEMQERCTVDNDHITFTAGRTLGANVRYAGEDIAFGSEVLKKGTRLSAIELGLLASLGIAKVSVYQPLKVALIATGDELKKPGEILQEGDIYESNGYVLKPLLKKLNIDVIDFGVIGDDFEVIKAAFEQADEIADVVISSGGVSVGEADYTKAALEDLGKIGFWKLAMKPGKPFAFGQLKSSVFFGLPGNPVSALVTLYQLGVPALVKMQNQLPLNRPSFKVKCTTNIKKAPGRKDFQRGILSTTEKGELSVVSTGSQGSGILSSLAKANCFIIIEAEQGSVTAGEMVTVEPFDYLLV